MYDKTTRAAVQRVDAGLGVSGGGGERAFPGLMWSGCLYPKRGFYSFSAGASAMPLSDLAIGGASRPSTLTLFRTPE